MSKSVVAVALTLFAAIAAPARADETTPIIEVGAGTEYSGASHDASVLIRVNAQVQKGDAWNYWFVARLHGDVAVDPEGQSVPYLNVEFEPVGQRANFLGIMGEWQALPGQVGVNLRLDEAASFRIDAIGFAGGFDGTTSYRVDGYTPPVTGFVKVAIDMLGYKFVNLANQGMFSGLSVADFKAELGAVFSPLRDAIGQARNTFQVRVVFGGSADIAQGTIQGKAAALAEYSFYNEVSADLGRYVRLFVRNGVNAVQLGTDGTSGSGTQAEYQFMAGTTILF